MFDDVRIADDNDGVTADDDDATDAIVDTVKENCNVSKAFKCSAISMAFGTEYSHQLNGFFLSPGKLRESIHCQMTIEMQAN